MLQKLDRIRRRGLGVVILGHARVKNFNDPLGPNYDKYLPACNEKTWEATARWADDVFFLTTKTIAVDSRGAVADLSTKGKKKGVGGDERVLYTEQRAGYVAKNKWGMEHEIVMPDVPGEMWKTLMAAMKQTPSDEAPPE
jgi:hypothetical protein